MIEFLLFIIAITCIWGFLSIQDNSYMYYDRDDELDPSED